MSHFHRSFATRLVCSGTPAVVGFLDSELSTMLETVALSGPVKHYTKEEIAAYIERSEASIAHKSSN